MYDVRVDLAYYDTCIYQSHGYGDMYTPDKPTAGSYKMMGLKKRTFRLQTEGIFDVQQLVFGGRIFAKES